MEKKTHMDAAAINRRIDGCLHEKDAPCATVCPLGLDIRGFIKKIRRGSLGAAYRMYREVAVFPEIAAHICHAPCQNVCLRCEIDDAVQLQELERSSVEAAGKKSPDIYNLPHKEGRIAVIGAGLSGLTCALRLAAQGYDVSVYEAGDKIGGSLIQEMNPVDYLAEFQRQFTGKNYSLYLNTTVTELSQLDYDAIYIATGMNGPNFLDVSDQERLFRGGKLTGAIGTEIIRDGIRAASRIKAYLDQGLREYSGPELPVVSVVPPLRKELLISQPSIRPAENSTYSKTEAGEEAKRCMLCQCSACMDHCDLLSFYNKTPHRVADDVYATLHQVPSCTNRMATRFSNACNQCGKCVDICPQSIDLGRLLLDTRKEMYSDGYLPEVFHHFWLQDMLFSTTEAELIFSEVDTVEYLFFPGCNLGASDPRYVTESYSWLLKTFQSVGVFLSCCGAPAYWSGAEDLFLAHKEHLLSVWEQFGRPAMVFACPTCQKFFAEHLPDIPSFSLYQMLAQKLQPIDIESSVRSMYLFDPCSARNADELKVAVRKIVALCKVHLVNPDLAQANDTCCGWGGHIYPADPTLYDHIVENRTTISEHPYITYCANCRDTFSQAGKESYHLLDLVFNLHQTPREKPDISTRRQLRLQLKALLKGESLMSLKEVPLHLSDAQRRQMERDLISTDEVFSIIQQAEQYQNKLFDEESGHSVAHMFLGNSTCWVEYQPEEDNTYTIFRIYSHRMKIEGECDIE